MSRFKVPFAQNITLIVTENCNLSCKYCYVPQQPNRMSLATAKSIVDFVLSTKVQMPEVVFEIIGGEPLLEADMLSDLTDYIVHKLHSLRHPWRDHYYFSYVTNGTQFTSNAKSLLLKHLPQTSVTLSLDGSRELQEQNRTGSYDKIMADFDWWREHFPACAVKSTLRKASLPYLYDSIRFFVDELRLPLICVNPVFEEAWTEAEFPNLYNRFKQIADYMLSEGRYKKSSLSLFRDNFEEMIGRAADPCDVRCGAGNTMLAFDTAGQIYPCIRFKMTHTRAPYQLGNIINGINPNRLRQFAVYQCLERDHCLECQSKASCSRCIAHEFDAYGHFNQRCLNLCSYAKALFQANAYFNGRLRQCTASSM